jgi:hypothetical protein
LIKYTQYKIYTVSTFAFLYQICVNEWARAGFAWAVI